MTNLSELNKLGTQGQALLGTVEQQEILNFYKRNIAITGKSGSGHTNLAHLILFQVAHDPKQLHFLGNKSADFKYFIDRGASFSANLDEYVATLNKIKNAKSDVQVLYIDDVDDVLEKDTNKVLPLILEMILDYRVNVITYSKEHSALHGLFDTTLDSTGEKIGQFNFEKDHFKKAVITVPYINLNSL